MKCLVSDEPQIEVKKPEVVPKHVALIMDGNRRYARKLNLKTEEGHLAGAENLLSIVEAGAKLGVEVMTVYAFSTENWLRSDPEIQSLFHIFELYLNKMRPQLIKNGIKLSTIGDLTPFPLSLKTLLFEVKNATKHGKNLELVLAINYGGRDDMTRAVRSIVKDIKSKKIDDSEISEELIASYLDTAKWPDPDLLIRTSGERRVSNFLLWQISYSEIYIASAFWPEFSKEMFTEAIEDYGRRKKRLGA